MQLKLVAACLAVLAVCGRAEENGVSGYDADVAQASSVVPPELAVFVAAASSATTTSITLEHTKVTITKHGGSSSSALSTGRRPRIIVTDAAAQGLVCLPKGRLSKKDSAAVTSDSGAEAVAAEDDKADLVVGQGSGVTATASASGSGAAASAASGSSSAAAASGSGSASAASGSGSSAAASSSEGGSAASSSSDGSTSTSTSGDASAEASSGSSHSSSSSEAGGHAVDVSGDHAEASATGADGSTTTINTGDRLIDDGYCECVPDYLCDDEGYINTFGAGIIDIRSNTKKAVRTYSSRCKEGQTCCRHREGEERAAIGWLPTGCGTRAPMRLDRRIVRGEAVRIGENPWMVALLKGSTDYVDGKPVVTYDYLCGGSLIAENIVLTAAHCLKEHVGERLLVRVGEWDTSSSDPVYPHEEIAITQTILHEKFNPKTLFNDVALVRLERPVEFAPHIGTICLPSDLSQVDLTDCVAAGWGKESFDQSVYSSILKEVPLSVVDSSSCQKALRTTRLGRFFRLHNSFTCAGGEPGVDTCKGDGGSPLVCRSTLPAGPDGEDTFVQVGIVAWGIGCGKDGVPGVYVDVAKMMPWIQTHLSTLLAEDDGY